MQCHISTRIAFLLSIVLSWIFLTGRLDSQILSFRTYTVKDGLASNDVEDISQDSYGNLWIGTSNGISVFDGKRFTNYSVKDGLPSNFIRNLIPDRFVPGKMWFTASQHVCSMAGGRCTIHTLPEQSVRTISQDSRGVIWCGTEHGVQCIDHDSIVNVPLPFAHQAVYHISCAGNGVIWFGLDSLLISYSPATGEARQTNFRGYGNGHLFKISSDKLGDVWAEMGNNVLLKIGTHEKAQAKSMSPGLSMFVMDGRDSIAWVGQFDEIGKFDLRQFPNGAVSRYKIWRDTLENEIKSGFVDREGNVWVGYLTKGIARLITENRMDFPIDVQWSVFDHQYVASDSNGHIWVLSHGDLEEFWRDKESRWHSYRHRFTQGDPYLPDFDFNLHSARAAAFSFDSAGHLWIARAEGQFSIICYDLQADTASPAPGDAGRSLLKRLRSIQFAHRIHSFLVEGERRLWVNLHSAQGMVVIDLKHGNKVLRKFTDKDGFPTVYVCDLFQDSRGNIWGSTLRDGVIRLAGRDVRSGPFRQFSIRDGLPSPGTFPLTENGSGNILVGLNNHGLAIIKGDSIKTLSMMDGLPSNDIASMTIDRLGRLWLGTGVGMIHETAPASWTFDENRSLLEERAIACGTTRDGLLWWVTPSHLSVYDYLSEPKSSLRPPVQIRGMKVNGERTEFIDGPEFSYRQNDVEIEFIGISLKNPEGVHYQYRLLGSEEHWNVSSLSTSILYGNLSPGTYTFEVIATTADGMKSDSPARASFTIAPPYWKRWWFYGSVIIIAYLVVYAGYRGRVRRLLREQRLSQEFSRQLISSQEDERKRVARELHDDLGQELIVISNRARRGLKTSSEDQTRSQFDLIVQTASRALESVREIAYNLSPYHLDQVGLAAAIRGMVERITALTDVRFTLNIDYVDSTFPKEIEIHLYRIAQECLNNIAKHSEASEASMTIRLHGNALEIVIWDNGKGFEVSAPGGEPHIRHGFGLSGLRERVRLLSGTLVVESSKGKGTKIRISLPRGKGSVVPAHQENDQKRRS